MSATLDAHIKEALWHIDADVDKGGWDQRPILLLVQHARLADGVGAICLQEIPGSAMVIERLGGQMQEALVFFINAVRGAPTSVRNYLAADLDGLYGVALVTEAWMVKQYMDAPAPDDYEGDLSQHPDRVECRLTHIAPVNGEGAQLIHERDSIAYLRENGELGGALPDLLADLAQTFASLKDPT